MNKQYFFQEKNNGINSTRTLSTQKQYHYMKNSQSNPLTKVNSCFNEKFLKDSKRTYNNYIDISIENNNNNRLYYDQLCEKVLNLYNLANIIKTKHNNERYSIKKNNNSYNCFINKNIIGHSLNLKNTQSIINKNILSDIELNNSSFKKIIQNKKNNIKKYNLKNKNLKKNRNYFYSISPKKNDLSSNNSNDIYTCNNFKSQCLDYNYRINNKLIPNQILNIKENNNNNKSPVGRFDSYFYNSVFYTDKKYNTNNDKDFKNSFNYLNSNKLSIESPTCISYQSFIGKNSNKEMSIEHNIEYDINDKKDSKLSIIEKNKIDKYKLDGVLYTKSNNLKLKGENRIMKKYKTLNNENLCLFNFNKKKFKSTTVSELIKDYLCNKSEKGIETENSSSKNSNNNTIKKNIYIQDYTNTNETNKKIINKLNSDIKTKNISFKNFTNNRTPIIKRTEKIVNNNIEITLEYNKENNIQKLILNDKKGKKINFISNNKSNNNLRKINNSNKRINSKYNNNIYMNRSSLNSLNENKDNLMIFKSNKKYKKGYKPSIQTYEINTVKPGKRVLCSKFKNSPQKFYTEMLCENELNSLEVSFPQNTLNQISTNNKKKKLINYKYRKTNKTFNKFKDKLLKSKNNNRVKDYNK